MSEKQSGEDVVALGCLITAMVVSVVVLGHILWRLWLLMQGMMAW